MDRTTTALAIAALTAACGLGWVVVDRYLPDGRDTIVAKLDQRGTPTSEISTRFTMCGRNRYTCVVDGDTIWLNGQNLRLQSYDTPEPYDDICGGQQEVALGKKASARLLQLLNTSPITVETFGLDNTGKRTLATIRIAGEDVGDILIEERLARRWPDGDEWWCR